MIKNITLKPADAGFVAQMLIAAGIGHCSRTNEFISLHGRNLLQEQKNEDCIEQRNASVARALTHCLNIGDVADMPSVMLTMFCNADGSNVMDSYPLIGMFTADERHKSVTRIGDAVGLSAKFNAFQGKFGRVTISHIKEGAEPGTNVYQLNATYTSVASEIFEAFIHTSRGKDYQLHSFKSSPDYARIKENHKRWPAKYDTDGSEIIDYIEITHATDMLMIRFTVDTAKMRLASDADRLTDKQVKLDSNIPVNSRKFTQGLESSMDSFPDLLIPKYLNEAGILGHMWLSSLAVTAGLEQIATLSSEKLTKLHSPDSEISSFRAVALDTVVTPGVGMHLNHVKTIHRARHLRERQTVGERTVAIRGLKRTEATWNDSSQSCWKSQIAGLTPFVDSISNGSSTNGLISYHISSDYFVAGGASVRMPGLLVGAINEAITSFNARLKPGHADTSTRPPAVLALNTVDGVGILGVSVAELGDLAPFLAHARDAVNRMLEVEYPQYLKHFILAEWEVNRFKERLAYNYTRTEDITASILFAMREVFNLFDIPKMPGEAGNFFRELEACETFEEAISKFDSMPLSRVWQ